MNEPDIKRSETPAELCSAQLLADGWREWPDQFRQYARCFFKHCETPTRCACNNDKEGIQICIAVYEHVGERRWVSYEVELHGQLPNETWIKFVNHGIDEFKTALAVIPRLLATWEVCANAEREPQRE